MQSITHRELKILINNRKMRINIRGNMIRITVSMKCDYMSHIPESYSMIINKYGCASLLRETISVLHDIPFDLTLYKDENNV
jgi:hypothetical protein